MDILSLKTSTGNLFRKPEMNWGILGTARISEQMIPALKAVKHNHVIAVASRDLTRARQFADKLQVPVAYSSYDELLADPTVHAVYIPLTNNEHKPWTIRALQAGKHVLVEKPFALNADEAQEMVGIAHEKGLVLMEGFSYRFHSRMPTVFDILRKGELGKLRFLYCSFSFSLENPDDFRLVPSLGGGALYDLGCYCVDFQRLAVEREPESVQARFHLGGSGVDLQMQVTLDFGNQIYGNFDVAFNAIHQNIVRIVGSEAVMTLDCPFSSSNKSVSMLIEKGEAIQKVSYRPENDYKNMAEHFYEVVIKKEIALYPLAGSVKTMEVIDAIFESAADNGKLVSLK